MADPFPSRQEQTTVPSMPQPAQPDHNTTDEVILGVDPHKDTTSRR